MYPTRETKLTGKHFTSSVSFFFFFYMSCPALPLRLSELMSVSIKQQPICNTKHFVHSSVHSTIILIGTAKGLSGSYFRGFICLQHLSHPCGILSTNYLIVPIIFQVQPGHATRRVAG